MAFNFPDPAVSTTATNPVTGAQYQWRADPGKWVLTGGPAEAPNPPVTISLLPPEGPQKGDLWIHEESLVEYAWDGTQWFEVGSSCGGGSEEEEEEKDLYFPFVNSYKLVAPDDFSGENGTATILTNAYDAGDDSYLSPDVKTVRFAILDLNDRFLERAIEGDSIQLTPENQKEGASNTLYGELKVTAVISEGDSTRYDVDVDFNRSVIYTEGDIVHYRISKSDLYLKKTGDTMTGTLVMENAELDFMVSGESLKDSNGDPVLDSSGKEKWDDSIDRFSHIESLPPRILRSDGTYGSDTSGPFGIRVEIDDGNTHRNRFVVGNRNGDMVTVTGGTGPAVTLGSGFPGNQDKVAPGDEGKVRIKGIATPDFETADDDVAVNKKYVDERDEFLQQEIIELEEEIDAIAPSVERGEWSYTNTGIASVRGSYSMNTDTFDAGLGDPANIFAAAENIVLNERDLGGTIHSFANVEPGQLLEIFESGDSDYGLYEIIKAEAKSGGGVNSTPAYNYWSIDVKLVRTGVGDTAEAKARFKIFSPPSGGTADGFVLKSGDKMSGTLRVPILQGYKPSDDSDAYPRINLDNNIYGATMEWGPNRLRISWNETGGNLYTGYGSSAEAALKWTRSNVNDGNTSQVLYYGAITEPKNLVTKGYVDDVDDKITALLARIEELEKTAGGSMDIVHNHKVLLDYTTSTPTNNNCAGATSLTQQLRLAINGVALAPRGRIQVIKSGSSASDPVLMYNVTDVKKIGHSSYDMDRWEVGVALDNSAAAVGSYSISTSRDTQVYVSLLDGVFSEEPALGTVSFTVSRGNMQSVSSSSGVTDKHKAYTLDSSGSLTSNQNSVYGLFMPYDFLNDIQTYEEDSLLQSEGGYHVIGLDENTYGYWMDQWNDVSKNNITERTLNGIKGISIHYYSSTNRDVWVRLNRLYLQYHVS
jgi:hypothetical protein